MFFIKYHMINNFWRLFWILDHSNSKFSEYWELKNQLSDRRTFSVIEKREIENDLLYMYQNYHNYWNHWEDDHKNDYILSYVLKIYISINFTSFLITQIRIREFKKTGMETLNVCTLSSIIRSTWDRIHILYFDSWDLLLCLFSQNMNI